MKNPWEEISLNTYELHMGLESVMQLQAMNEIMNDQFYNYPVSTVMILGIAGGNGLDNINTDKIKKVYGVDINENYLSECVKRYPELREVFTPILCDIQSEDISLPKAEIVVANLFIEYVGYENFKRAIQRIQPEYVSCVIQVNTDNSFVSDSPYLHEFDGLDEVHREINRNELITAMEDIKYVLIYEESKALPNGKSLLRLDFKNSISN